MPLPKPGGSESKKKFLARCMSATADEFPDSDQRFAVCNRQWEGGSGKKALVDILNDFEFWESMRVAVVGRAMPIFREAFLVGTQLGADQREVRERDTEQPSFGFATLGMKQDDVLPAFQRLPLDFEAAIAASDQIIGTYTDDWWGQFQRSTQSGLRAAIQRAEANGLGVESVIKDIEPLFGAARAGRIAVSETTNLIGMGAQETYRQTGYRKWEWRTVRDAKVDPICKNLDRKQFPITRQFQRAHPNCRCIIPGQMALAEGVRSAMVRRYEGTVVTIETARGYKLTVTPNHPIATPTGWLPAAEVHEGMHVFSDSVWDDRGLGQHVPDHIETPALIEDVVESLRQAPSVSSRTMPTATEDFHGDGGHGDVDVVTADRSLAIGHESKRADRFFKRSLGLVGSSPIFARESIEDALVFGSRHATDSSMCTGDLLVPLGVAHAVPARSRSSRTSSESYARIPETLRYRVARDGEAACEFGDARAVLVGAAKTRDVDRPQMPRSFDPAPPQFSIEFGLRDASRGEDGMEGLPRFVTPDRVVGIRVGHYVGPVYNLETATGWYTAAGITVHNCFPVPAGKPVAPTLAGFPV